MGFIYCQTVYTAASKYVDPKKNSLKRVHIIHEKGVLLQFMIHKKI